MAGKRLELLKETVPKLTLRCGVVESTGCGLWANVEESQVAARELGLQIHSMEVSSSNQFENAFKEATKAGSAALALMGSPFFFSNQKQIVELAAKHRLPAIYANKEFVVSGGLMSYGADEAEPYRRMASIIDKILKGKKTSRSACGATEEV